MSDKPTVNPQLEAVHDIEVAANWVVWSMEHGKDPARTLCTLREKIAAFQSVTDVASHDLTPSEVTPTKIVITRRFADYHAAIDGANGCKWGCGKTIDEAVGSLVRNHPGAFGAIVDLEKVGAL